VYQLGSVKVMLEVIFVSFYAVSTTVSYQYDLVHNALKIAHHNLKPSNILLDSSNTLRLVDTGVWHLIEPFGD